MKKDVLSKLKQLFTDKSAIFVIGIFLFHIFFIFYQLKLRASFGWDQVDNAWAAIRILREHRYPLLGMVAKQNSGMYIGPLYYYLVAIFYYITQLNPIASPLLAACTAIFSFFVIFFVSNGLFGKRVAVWSCFIYTVSSFIIQTEHNQWPVNFVAPISLLIFYFLFLSVTRDVKYLLYTAVGAGLAFHIHFTAIFYPLIILCTLPLLPKSRKTILYVLFSLIIIIVIQTPQIIYYFQHKQATNNYQSYFQTYYQGLHLRRVLQLAHDAFIEFQAILDIPYSFLRSAVFLYIPSFIICYVWSTKEKHRFVLPYLIILWIAVPWLIFSTYKGALTDYYFLSQLYIAVILYSYITVWLLSVNKILLSIPVLAFWSYFTFANVQAFFNLPEGNLEKNTTLVKTAVSNGKVINYTDGDPQSYLYYIYKPGQ